MRIATLLALSLVTLVACGGDDSSAEPVADEVLVENSRFVPTNLTVDVGTTVTFRWADGASGHNVTPWTGNAVAQPASPDTPTFRDAPFEFTSTFDQAGVFRFYCSRHGSVTGGGGLSGMAGTITVQ